MPQEGGRERFPGLAPEPQPWFELVLTHLDETQQRIVLARLMDMVIAQQEQVLELARMTRAMLKEGTRDK